MFSKGLIMLTIGVSGLVLTIIWIIFDLKNKSKHEEKIINKAIKNFTSTNLAVNENNNTKYERISNVNNDLEEDTEFLTDLIDKNHEINEDTEIMEDLKDEEKDENQTELLTELIKK